MPPLSLNIYVPRDELFNHVKFKDFLTYGGTAIVRVIIPEIASVLARPFNEFNSFKHVLEVYKDSAEERSRECMPWKILKGQFHKYPIPHVIEGTYVFSFYGSTTKFSL